MTDLSTKLVDLIAENGTIDPKDKELYSYGLHQGLIIISNMITTIIIGAVLGVIWESIFFMMAYIPLRTFAGGYHSKTQMRCYLFSIVFTSVTLGIIRFIKWSNIINFGMAIVACVIIFTLAPVEDSNKPLDQIEIVMYKRRTRAVLFAEFSILLLTIIFSLRQIPICITVSLVALSIMLILGKIKKRFKQDQRR